MSFHPIKLEEDEYQNVSAVKEASIARPAKRKKCGEIYSENHSNFVLICAICKSTYLDLIEFGRHYLQEHVDKPEADSNKIGQYDSVETHVKIEQDIPELKIKEAPTIPEFIDIGKTDGEELITNEATKLTDNTLDKINTKLFCDICNKRYASPEGLRKHNCKPNRGKVKLGRPKRNRTKSLIAEKCSWCGKVHSALQDCQDDSSVAIPEQTKHSTTKDTNNCKSAKVTDSDLYCDICSRQFHIRLIFRQHALHQHSTPPQALKRFHDYLQCMYCYENFTEVSEWRQHENGHKNEKQPFVCPHCPKRCRTRFQMRDHINTHTGAKPYKCDQCSSGFACQTNLICHKTRVHLKSKQYACKLCDKKYTKNCELSVHIKREHTGERPYQCETCGKCYVLHALLRAHRLRHTNTRNHQCPRCSKTFFSAPSLSEHLRIHSNERGYSCNICAKGFKAYSALQMHRKLHSDTKQYKCKICEKEFAQLAGLYSHTKSHRVANSGGT